jgi:hypothetical protein
MRYSKNSAHWFHNPGLIANPLYVAGNHTVPQLIHVNNGGQNTVAGGAVITGPLSGVGFGAGGAITTFKSPACAYYANATLPPYISTATSTSTSFCYGGSVNQNTSAAQVGLLSFPLQQGTGFFFGTFKFTPDIQGSLMLNYGYDRSHSSSLTGNDGAVIKSDNAYLNPTLATLMKAERPDSDHGPEQHDRWARFE